MSRFTPEQLEYFQGFPTWVVATWALAVWGGVGGTVLLLLRKRLAVPVLAGSFGCMVATSVHNFVFTDGLEVMGPAGAVFSGVIFGFALALWVYARRMAGKDVLV